MCYVNDNVYAMGLVYTRIYMPRKELICGLRMGNYDMFVGSNLVKTCV